MKSVYEFLKNLNISENEPLIVAVSYGPDSMALLDIIKKKYKKNTIICAHVHHNHRKESDIEAKSLEEYCLKNNIIFEMIKIENYTNNKFTEEEARNKRYDFFEELLEKYNSKYLFTAHHGDDLVETVLMKITRGSTLKGYSGISLVSKRENYELIRPLLFIAKDDILNYCFSNNISYAVDKSNLDDDYTRNRYRKYVLPRLKEENKLVHKQFLKFSTVLTEYEEYFSKLTDNLYGEIVFNDVIYLDKLIKNELLVIKRIIMRYLYNHYDKDISKITDEHLNSIISIIINNKANKIICLPNNKKLIKSYNKMFFDKSMEYNDYCFLFDNFVNLPNNFIIKKENELLNTSNYVTALNSSEITLPIYVRNVLDGDKIMVLGLNGSKKIHDIFITEKIEKEKRRGYPVLVDSKGEVLWLPGIKKSKYDKSKIGNYDIILRYYKEEIEDESK